MRNSAWQDNRYCVTSVKNITYSEFIMHRTENKLSRFYGYYFHAIFDGHDLLHLISDKNKKELYVKERDNI